MYYADEGVILRRFSYGEGDVVLRVFTKEHGKISLVAKGVRKINSRRGGHLDLFNHIHLHVRDKGELGLITEAKAINTYSETKTSLLLLGEMYFIADLFDQLFLDEEKSRRAFKSLINIYTEIYQISIDDTTSGKLDERLARFERGLLQEVGYWSEHDVGSNYPNVPLEQRNHHKRLFEEILEKPIKSANYFRKFDFDAA